MKKIRVLQCATKMNRGGLETLIMNFYRNIDLDKFQFDFLVQRNEKADYDDEIKKLGGKIYYLPSFNPFKIREYNHAIDEFFKNHAKDYDIVHAHNNSFAMYLLRSAKKYGIKVRISHSHIAKNKINYKYPFILYNKIKLKKYCNKQFACGIEAGKFLFGNDKSIVINNAVDLSKFKYNEKQRDSIRNQYNLSKDEVVIGHVGRFEEQKNHKFLIKIMEQFKNTGKDVKLLLIGEGSLKKQIEDCVEKLNLQNNVIFIGNVNNVYDYLNAMDVFVLPSLFEGLPVTLVEAQANGIQCLVSDNVPSESKLTSLVTFMSLNENINNWNNMILILAKKHRIDEMNKIIESGFEIKSATKKLENMYIELVNKNN